MKKIINFIAFVGLLGVLVTYSSCKKNTDTVTPVTDVQLLKLIPSAVSGTSTSASWKLSSATLDGVDKIAAGDYTTSFTLTLTGTLGSVATAPFTYTTTKPTASLSPWEQSGSFTFDSTNPETKINRVKDGLAMTYTVNGTQLQVSFNFSASGYDRSSGKTEVVAGQWIFIFTK